MIRDVFRPNAYLIEDRRGKIKGTYSSRQLRPHREPKYKPEVRINSICVGEVHKMFMEAKENGGNGKGEIGQRIEMKDADWSIPMDHEARGRIIRRTGGPITEYGGGTEGCEPLAVRESFNAERAVICKTVNVQVQVRYKYKISCQQGCEKGLMDVSGQEFKNKSNFIMQTR